MVHLAIALQPHELVDPDRARLADPAQVVAHQVDDHHVLGPVLGVGDQIGGGIGIGQGIAAAGAGALDRPGLHRAAGRNLQKPFRRGRQHGLQAAAITCPGGATSAGGAAAGNRQAGEGGRAVAAQLAIEGQGIGGGRQNLLTASTEVGLKQVAPGNQVAHLAHLVGEAGGAGMPMPGPQGDGGGFGGRLVGQGLDHGGQLTKQGAVTTLQPEPLLLLIEPQHRVMAGRPEHGHVALAPMGARFHPGPGPVGQPTHPVATAGHHRRQGAKGVLVAALHQLPRRHPEHTPAAQVRAVPIEPHQPFPAEAFGQAPGQRPGIAPGQLQAPHQPWWRPWRPRGVASWGWPASIRAASRMRQLSHRPQGSLPPL